MNIVLIYKVPFYLLRRFDGSFCLFITIQVISLCPDINLKIRLGTAVLESGIWIK